MSVLSEVLKIEEEDFEQLCNIYNDKERFVGRKSFVFTRLARFQGKNATGFVFLLRSWKRNK